MLSPKHGAGGTCKRLACKMPALKNSAELMPGEAQTYLNCEKQTHFLGKALGALASTGKNLLRCIQTSRSPYPRFLMAGKLARYNVSYEDCSLKAKPGICLANGSLVVQAQILRIIGWWSSCPFCGCWTHRCRPCSKWSRAERRAENAESKPLLPTLRQQSDELLCIIPKLTARRPKLDRDHQCDLCFTTVGVMALAE